jgi:hypothetical protein
MESGKRTKAHDTFGFGARDLEPMSVPVVAVVREMNRYPVSLSGLHFRLSPFRFWPHAAFDYGWF